jgi:hypothetical protein
VPPRGKTNKPENPETLRFGIFQNLERVMGVEQITTATNFKQELFSRDLE